MTNGGNATTEIDLDDTPQSAVILDFPLEFEAPAAKDAAAAEEAGATAEIIIFPGIRIERWEETCEEFEQQTMPPARQVKRDMLELLD